MNTQSNELILTCRCSKHQRRTMQVFRRDSGA